MCKLLEGSCRWKLPVELESSVVDRAGESWLVGLVLPRATALCFLIPVAQSLLSTLSSPCMQHSGSLWSTFQQALKLFTEHLILFTPIRPTLLSNSWTQFILVTRGLNKFQERKKKAFLVRSETVKQFLHN